MREKREGRGTEKDTWRVRASELANEKAEKGGRGGGCRGVGVGGAGGGGRGVGRDRMLP